MRVLSLGAGVQSTTLALLAAKREIQPPDCAIFADTQWEPAAVYQHLDWLETQLPFPVHRVTKGNLLSNLQTRRNTSGGQYAAIPFFIVNADGSHGIGRRQCTHEYKLEPIRREIRRLLGKGPRSPIAAGSVTMLIGISADEAHRAKDSTEQYLVNSYPLLDLNWRRSDCLGWLARNGYPRPPKSACIGCPYTSDMRWMDRKANQPEEWQAAVEADRKLRTGDGVGMRGAEYMHAQRVPLDRVDFSRVDHDRQPDLFGEDCSGMCGT